MKTAQQIDENQRSPQNSDDAMEAQNRFNIWPLDDSNAKLLNEVHPKTYANPEPLELYDLIALGAGAGGLVSSKQSGWRGAKSAIIRYAAKGFPSLQILFSVIFVSCFFLSPHLFERYGFALFLIDRAQEEAFEYVFLPDLT
mmetsp:Transcript_996/g.1175  ORF Transcript_996/g.1175 Transcript_996/m.1175 type:complete len:142 (+) Transcript_996:688-1113(+)